MPSSVIKRLRYDEAAGALTVRFTSGSIYRYDAVPKPVYDAFRAAESRGSFFSAEVRDRYPTTRIG
jgi:lysyl-tRNA synthetase class 2